MAENNEAPKSLPPELNARVNPASSYQVETRGALRQKLPVVIALGLFGLVVWTFLPSLQNGFIDLDDPIYITENIHIRNGFTWAGVGWAFVTSLGGSWHPLTWFSLMLDCQLYGLHPAGHHFTDILLHAGSSVLLFFLFLRMTGAIWRSAFVAALFAFHPLHVESVAWAAERKDTLSTLFWMFTLLAYVRYVKLGAICDSRSKRYYALALLLFLLGLMSKPMLITLPLVLLLLDWWPLLRFQFPARHARNLAILKEKLPFFVLAAFAAVTALLTQMDFGAVTTFSDLTLANRIGNASLSYWRYLAEMFWPNHLALFYPLPDKFPLLPCLGAAAGLAISSALFIRAGRTRPELGFGWLWYLVTLLPVIGIIQIGQQSHADRYTYIPLIGVFVLLTWGISELARYWHLQKSVLSVVGLGVIAVCIWFTRAQLCYWRDTETLFRRSVAVTDGNVLAEDVLGRLYARKGSLDEALKHLREAIRVAPAYAGGHNDLGSVLAMKGREDEAIGHFQEALRIRPRFAEAHHNLALALQHKGLNNEAIAHFQKAVDFKPDYATAHRNLGILLGKQGWLDEAIGHLNQAIQLSPDDAGAHCNLGITLGKRGRVEEAVSELRMAVKLNPNDAEAQCNLGVALGAKNQLDEAITHLQAALKLKPDYPDARSNLSIALDQKPAASSKPGAGVVP